MAILIGVSSGIFAAAPEEEKMQYIGLARKAMYCITKGVEFVQIDLESVSEFREPELKKEMEKVKRLGVSFGIHSETKAFGIEVSEFDSAIETDYKFGHERLREILEKSGELGAKYVLIHSSESEPFLFLERHLQPAALVDFFGNPLREFLEKNPFLIDWLLGGKIEEVASRVFEEWLTKGRAITDVDIGKVAGFQEYIWREMFGYGLGEILRGAIEGTRDWYERQFRKRYEDFTAEEKKIADEHVKREIEITLRSYRIRFLETIQSRTVHYGPERIAYYLVAKWMEISKDALWENIVKATIDYFAKTKDKKSEELLNEIGIKKLSVDDENFRKYSYLWVPAVSAKYIWGHLMQDKNPKGEVYPDFKKIIKKYNMPLALETPMAHRGVEEWLRLPNPIQMYYLAKQVNEEVGFDCLVLAMDFEHMISIKLEPEKVIEALPEDGGKFVRIIHVGWPSPLAPAHVPIPIGSEQQQYIYKMLYGLRKKGFGKDKNDFYIVFERGGGIDPIKQSILALRLVKEFLEKEIPPEKLVHYPEFYGIEPKGFLSEERQRAIIFEHRFEPLKGLIMVPEEEYTFLGEAATRRPGVTPEKWKREELK